MSIIKFCDILPRTIVVDLKVSDNSDGIDPSNEVTDWIHASWTNFDCVIKNRYTPKPSQATPRQAQAAKRRARLNGVLYRSLNLARAPFRGASGRTQGPHGHPSTGHMYPLTTPPRVAKRYTSVP